MPLSYVRVPHLIRSSRFRKWDRDRKRCGTLALQAWVGRWPDGRRPSFRPSRTLGLGLGTRLLSASTPADALASNSPRSRSDADRARSECRNRDHSNPHNRNNRRNSRAQCSARRSVLRCNPSMQRNGGTPPVARCRGSANNPCSSSSARSSDNRRGGHYRGKTCCARRTGSPGTRCSLHSAPHSNCAPAGTIGVRTHARPRSGHHSANVRRGRDFSLSLRYRRPGRLSKPLHPARQAGRVSKP